MTDLSKQLYDLRLSLQEEYWPTITKHFGSPVVDAKKVEENLRSMRNVVSDESCMPMSYEDMQADICAMDAMEEDRKANPDQWVRVDAKDDFDPLPSLTMENANAEKS